MYCGKCAGVRGSYLEGRGSPAKTVGSLMRCAPIGPKGNAYAGLWSTSTVEDAAIDHELLPMLLSLADRSCGLLLRIVDGAADQLAMSGLAVRSTDHWSVSGLRAPTEGASDDDLEVGRRNLIPFSSGGGLQPSGPKSTMLIVQCPLER